MLREIAFEVKIKALCRAQLGAHPVDHQTVELCWLLRTARSGVLDLRKPPRFTDLSLIGGGLSYNRIFYIRGFFLFWRFCQYKKAPPFLDLSLIGGGFLIKGGFLKSNTPDWCGRARRRRRKNRLLEAILMDFRDLFPPQFRDPWGGNFSFLPPNSEGLWGETENHFPPTIGGKKRCPV